MLGIQYAKASGLTVITTASPHNFEYLKSLGADAVFDYRSPTCGAEIREFTKNKLRHAWDCAGKGEAMCAAALSDAEPSKYASINMASAEVLKATNALVEGPFTTLGYDAEGEAYTYAGVSRPAMPDEMEFATMFIELSQDLLGREIIKPIRITVNLTGPGLQGAMKGLDELRGGKVSGMKLVYTL